MKTCQENKSFLFGNSIAEWHFQISNLAVFDSFLVCCAFSNLEFIFSISQAYLGWYLTFFFHFHIADSDHLLLQPVILAKCNDWGYYNSPAQTESLCLPCCCAEALRTWRHAWHATFGISEREQHFKKRKQFFYAKSPQLLLLPA